MFTQPIEMDVASLEEYCAEMGGAVQVQCVPQGFDLMPPTIRVEELDNNPDLREDKEKVQKMFELELTKEEIDVALLLEDEKDDASSSAWE